MPRGVARAKGILGIRRLHPHVPKNRTPPPTRRVEFVSGEFWLPTGLSGGMVGGHAHAMPSPFRLMTPVVLGLCLTATVGLAQTSVDPRLATLRKLIQDPSPKVRLEALRAVAKIPSAESAALALSALDRPMDPALDYALWHTINDLSEPWIAALQSGAWKPEGHEKQLEFALKAIRPEQASRVLGQLLVTKPLARDGQGPWIELIGAAGSPRELRQIGRAHV